MNRYGMVGIFMALSIGMSCKKTTRSLGEAPSSFGLHGGYLDAGLMTTQILKAKEFFLGSHAGVEVEVLPTAGIDYYQLVL